MASHNKVCKVLVDAPVNKLFDYKTGGHEVVIGSRVRVPFGRKMALAVVVKTMADSHLPSAKVRGIIDVLDSRPWFSNVCLDFLMESAEAFMAGHGEMVIGALPRALKSGAKRDFPSLPHLKLASQGEFIIHKSGLSDFRAHYLSQMQGHHGPVLVIVESLRKAEELCAAFNQRGLGDVFLYHNNVVYKQLDKMINSLSRERCVVIGTRHLALFPILRNELIFVENGWLDVYRQEVFPRYNVRDLLLIRAKHGGGRYFLHEEVRNNVEVVAIDAMTHKAFPYFVEEEIKKDVANGLSWGVFAIGKSFAKRIVCHSCKRTLVCDVCSRPFVLKKIGKKDVLFCKSCDKAIEWDYKCTYCRAIAITLKGWGSQKLLNFIKSRLSGLPVYEALSDDDKAQKGVYFFEHWQNITHRFDNVLLIGLDAVLNLDVFYAKDLAIGFINSASNRAKKKLYVHTGLVEITNDDVLEKECLLKKRFHLPPFGEMVRLIFKASSLGRALKKAGLFCNKIEERGLSKTIYMPVYVPKQERKRRKHYCECLLLLDSAQANHRDDIYEICLKMRGTKDAVMVPEVYKEPLLSC